MTNTTSLAPFSLLSPPSSSPSALPARAQFPWAGARAVGMGGARSRPSTTARPHGPTRPLWRRLRAGASRSSAAAWRAEPQQPGRDVVDLVEPSLRRDRQRRVELDLRALTSSRTWRTSCSPTRAVVFSGVAGHRRSLEGFALSVGTVPYAGIYPVIDLQHIVPGGGPDNGLEFNETGLNLAGLNAREVRLGLRPRASSADRAGSEARRECVSRVTYFARCGVFRFACDSKDLGDLISEAFEQNALSSTSSRSTWAREVNFGIFRSLASSGRRSTSPTSTVAVVPGAPGHGAAAAPVPGRRRRRRPVVPDARGGRRHHPKSDTLVAGDPEPAALARRRVSHPALRLPRRRGFHDFAAMDPPWALLARRRASGFRSCRSTWRSSVGPTGGLRSDATRTGRRWGLGARCASTSRTSCSRSTPATPESCGPAGPAADGARRDRNALLHAGGHPRRGQGRRVRLAGGLGLPRRARQHVPPHGAAGSRDDRRRPAASTPSWAGRARS